jgi:hypothetical protein
LRERAPYVFSVLLDHVCLKDSRDEYSLYPTNNQKQNNNEDRLVDKSHCRAPGKAPPNTGNRYKLLAALTLAASAAGYLVLDGAHLRTGELVAYPSGTVCHADDRPDSDTAPACIRPPASPGDPRGPDVAANNSTPAPINASRSGGTATGLPQHDVPGLRDEHANSSGAWDDAQVPSRRPRPGYTVAELCSSGIDNKGFRCQAGSYSELLNEPGSDGAPGSASGRTISGHVLSDEGVGLYGVTILASPERLKGQPIPRSETLRFRTVTDSLGAYHLEGLPDGEYTIRSSAHGPYPSARISARAGVDYADLVVSQDSPMVIEGRVLADTGESLEGVTVLPGLLGQPSVLTGPDGRFLLPVTLKPKIQAIVLRFLQPGYREQTAKVKLPFPATPGAAEMNVVMQPVEAWTSLRGSVYSDSGEPLAGRSVELRPLSEQRAYRTTTDADGQYTFPMLESPAAYRLTVFGGARHKDHQQPLQLTADTSELDVVVDAYEFGEVSGRLVNPNGEPVPDFDLVLRNTASRRPNTLVSTDRDGKFEMPEVPAGELVLASQSTPAFLVQGLRLEPGENLRLPLVLDWGEHEIHGLVVDARGNPVPASRVLLQWSHEADGVVTRATRRTASDAYGQFTFNNLGPGPHSLQIDAPGFAPVSIVHDISRKGYDVNVRLN